METKGLIHKPTQSDKILAVLEKNFGEWVSGEYFLREMYLSQYHARIWDLQQKGHNIEARKQVILSQNTGLKVTDLSPAIPYSKLNYKLTFVKIKTYGKNKDVHPLG